MSSSRKKHRSQRRNTPSPQPVLSRRVIALVAIGIVVAGIALWSVLSSQTTDISDFVPEVAGAPRVAVAQEIFDYGDVKLNSTVETVFKVRNVGDQDLRLLDGWDGPRVELVRGC